MIENDATAVERIIGKSMGPMIRELLLVDPADYIALLKFGNHDQIADLIDSAAEQFFAPGFVAYRETGYAEVDWERTPSVHLQMVVNSPNRMFAFTLSLEAQSALIKLRDIHLTQSGMVGNDTATSLTRAFELNTIDHA